MMKRWDLKLSNAIQKSGPFSKKLSNAIPATDSILSSVEGYEKHIWNINNSVVNISINFSFFNPCNSVIDAKALIKENLYRKEKIMTSKPKNKVNMGLKDDKTVVNITNKRKSTLFLDQKWSTRD